ncbi:Ca2+:H+ antiporter [Trueperella bonasi]|uniref:Ca2+:H+ antiporter n=1 Tax=Trueperella bonasi TaxID=312286 RepID=A0ABT9NJ14_9ACTO|nr:hypothetical protein [Trueperella bonasi]MDP9806808.1 Ca2+:H+ antiporter [Trueperella bonasi]
MPAVVSWLAVLAAHLLKPADLLALIGLLAAVIYASFGVMRRADALSRKLAEPFGTIILTVSIGVIEVSMVVSVLLGPGNHSSIARDTAFSSAMLLINLILGGAILVGGLRHGPMRFRMSGVARYLVAIALLCFLTFAVPLLIDDDGAVAGASAAIIATVLACAYALFMWRQLGPNSADFSEPKPNKRSTEPACGDFVWLVFTLVPVVLLSRAISPLLDAAVPDTALAGLLIAIIVLLPETFTTVKAGWNGEIQRVSNLSHGALVAVLGLSVPTVLVIAAITGQRVVLGAGSSELALLGLTIGLCLFVLNSGRARAGHGAAHLAIFVAYLVI